jgi:hypothetical protein
MHVERGDGLLVPANSAAGREVVDAKMLRAQLLADRELARVGQQHQLQQMIDDANHQAALADLQERLEAERLARKERAKTAAAEEKIGRLYRKAISSGTRLQLRTSMLLSAEKRAQRVARVRTASLVVLVPVLVGFAAWSTAGVQAGAVRLGDLKQGEAVWKAAWALEPCLITVVAFVIIVRAWLRSSGGNTDWRFAVAEWSALGTSVAFNLIGGWIAPTWAGFGNALMHSVGPLGCAGIAFLIGAVDDYVTDAKPYEGAQRLADIDLVEARKVRKTIDEIAPATQSAYALEGAQPAHEEGRITQSKSAQRPRKGGAQPGRARRVTRPATSSYAPGEDPGTRAAQDLDAGKFKSLREAAAAYDVSEGTVRNRLKAFPAQKPINGHPVLTEELN